MKIEEAEVIGKRIHVYVTTYGGREIERLQNGNWNLIRFLFGFIRRGL